MTKGTKNSLNKKSTKSGTSIKSENKLLVWAIVLVVLLIVMAVSLTYAYFSRSYSQVGEDPKVQVATGKLDVDFVTSEYINNSNAQLINDNEAYSLADKSIFSVTRSVTNTVEKVYYKLDLVDIDITDNLKSPYLKWRLYETDVISATTEPLSEGDFQDLEGDSIPLYTTKISLAKGVVHNFVLMVWLSNDENKNQTELLKGTFKAKVEVTAVNVED